MDSLTCEELLAPPVAKVSFQSSTANAWATSFVRHLSADLGKSGLHDPELLLAKVCHAAQAMFNERCHALPDTQSRTVLGMCALMLAAYRELQTRTGHGSRAFDLVEHSFGQTYQAFIQNICKPLLLNANRTPRTLAGMSFRAWSERLYPEEGRRHAVARESDTTGYHHFFQQQGEPALAQIIQRADQAWIEAVAAYGQSQLSERRRTRAGDGAVDSSDDFVPFRFAPGGSRRSASRPTVVLELQINVAHTAPDRRGHPAAADRRRHWDGIDRRQSARRQDDSHIWS